MNKYESLIVIDKNSSEEEIKCIVKNIAELIDKTAEITAIRYLGLQIPKYNVVGYSFLFAFRTKLEIVEELEKSYQTNKKVVYDLTILKKSKGVIN